jgi:hypothetical protein
VGICKGVVTLWGPGITEFSLLSGLTTSPFGVDLLICRGRALKGHRRYRSCGNGAPEASVWLAVHERCVEY